MIPEKLWVYRARPQRVIDGDTVALEIDLGFGISKASGDNHIRVRGVNCPEVHGQTTAAGLAASSFTRVWTATADDISSRRGEDWPLIIQTEQLEGAETRTFERWVADIWRVSDGHSLADDLLAAGHAVVMKG